jgi:HSP20 family protein
MVEAIFNPVNQNREFIIIDNIHDFQREAQTRHKIKRSHVWRPPTDVFELEDVIVIRVEIAGMREQDFSILLDAQTIVVQGFRSDVAEKRAYHQMEIRFGEFACEVEIPYHIDSERIEAVYANGFLRITIPKVAPRQVLINQKPIE